MEFAESLFDDSVDYWERHRYNYDPLAVRLTEHADPQVYASYVRAVANAIVEAVTGLVREHGR